MLDSSGKSDSDECELREEECVDVEDTANRCHQNGIRFTPVVDGHAEGWGDSASNLVTWICHCFSLPPHS